MKRPKAVVHSTNLHEVSFAARARKNAAVDLIDLIEHVRDLIDERCVLCRDRQAGAIDDRVRDGMQAQQIVPQAFRIVKTDTHLEHDGIRQRLYSHRGLFQQAVSRHVRRRLRDPPLGGAASR